MTNTWTAEDSRRLAAVAADFRQRAQRETNDRIRRAVHTLVPDSIDANINLGSLNIPAFNSSIEDFISRGLHVTWDEFTAGIGMVHYRSFHATGDREIMRDFWNWYRGFFKIN